MAPKLPIYLDNHSTTRADPRVVEAMLPFFDEKYGNAASRSHSFGWTAESAVDDARARVAKLIATGDPKTIVFTSGATESDNLAIKGVAELFHSRGKHLVTTAVEHKAVIDSCKHLERAGFEVTYLPVDGKGLVDPADVERALRDDTLLVSVMLANNEVGTVQPIAEIGALTRAKNVLFHCDAVQGVGRVPFDVEAMNVDLASLSAHKIYGPKGVGALYVRRKGPRVRLIAQMDGGGHERSLRSGTLNVPGIVGFAKACDLLREEGPAENARIAELRDTLLSTISESLDDVTVNGAPDSRLPGNLNVSFGGVDAESLMLALQTVAVSSGAACSSATLEPSYVLRAMGVPDDLARSSIRFGIGRFNTAEEIDYAAKLVVEKVSELRAQRPPCEPAAEAAH